MLTISNSLPYDKGDNVNPKPAEPESTIPGADSANNQRPNLPEEGDSNINENEKIGDIDDLTKNDGDETMPDNDGSISAEGDQEIEVSLEPDFDDSTNDIDSDSGESQGDSVSSASSTAVSESESTTVCKVYSSKDGKADIKTDCEIKTGSSVKSRQSKPN